MDIVHSFVLLLLNKKEVKVLAGAIEQKVFEVADNVAEKLGVYVVDVEYKKENKERFLRVYIDKEGGVGLDECEEFSRRFDEVFDEMDIISEAYTFEVSSPGADRVLKTEREFNYYTGRRVEVKLYKAIDGKKEFDGILKGYENKTAIITVDEGDISVPVSEAVYIRLYFEI